VAYVRTVRTSSGAVAVQVVWKSRHGSRDIEHLGSAHTDAEVEVLKAVAAQRIADGQDELPFGVPARQEPVSLEITSSRMGRLLDAVAAVYRQLGLDKACGGDVVFEQLVTARIIEPTSKQDASRVLAEAGMRALSYRTVKRRLPVFARPDWRDRLSGACTAAAALGPSALVLYDVTTLWFETDAGDGFREPGFSKERRLDPQITVGLLTDGTGMPLMIDAFEGNRAETKTMIPLVQRFVAAHGIAGVTVVADAGMMSEANLADIEDAGWSFIIGGKLPEVPYVIGQWRRPNPEAKPVDGMVLAQPVIMGPKLISGAAWPSTSTRPIGPGGRCTASTSRWPRPRRRSPGRRRSNGTVSSLSPVALAPSTATSKRGLVRWPVGSPTSPTSTPTRPG
jgi:hypothetical protein